MKSGKVTFSQGSSPRMRGAPLVQKVTTLLAGIIPADAGSTVPLVLVLGTIVDHPRGCGEHIQALKADKHVTGSSPRMRGAHQIGRAGSAVTGIIPADAGSTLFGLFASSLFEDHPRGCGEHAPGQAFVQ